MSSKTTCLGCNKPIYELSAGGRKLADWEEVLCPDGWTRQLCSECAPRAAELFPMPKRQASFWSVPETGTDRLFCIRIKDGFESVKDLAEEECVAIASKAFPNFQKDAHQTTVVWNDEEKCWEVYFWHAKAPDETEAPTPEPAPGGLDGHLVFDLGTVTRRLAEQKGIFLYDVDRARYRIHPVTKGAEYHNTDATEVHNLLEWMATEAMLVKGDPCSFLLDTNHWLQDALTPEWVKRTLEAVLEVFPEVGDGVIGIRFFLDPGKVSRKEEFKLNKGGHAWRAVWFDLKKGRPASPDAYKGKWAWIPLTEEQKKEFRHKTGKTEIIHKPDGMEGRFVWDNVASNLYVTHVLVTGSGWVFATEDGSSDSGEYYGYGGDFEKTVERFLAGRDPVAIGARIWR